jgi:hypothetical protein
MVGELTASAWGAKEAEEAEEAVAIDMGARMPPNSHKTNRRFPGGWE